MSLAEKRASGNFSVKISQKADERSAYAEVGLRYQDTRAKPARNDAV
jgi:hypothetical protein